MISALPEKYEKKKIIKSFVIEGNQEKHIIDILKDPKILQDWAHH